MMCKTKAMCAALGVLLLLALLVPASQAQLRVTDNFNRADGTPGLGWSSWGNGAQIGSGQLETFGEIDVAGGIKRNLDVTFPLVFSFDFRTDDPADGGWLIGFNAAGTNVITVDDTSEVELLQFSGSRALCAAFQTSAGPSFQCADLVNGQRDFTAVAHILGRINSDFSATIRINYNDGQQPDTVTIKMSAPTGAIQSPLGSALWFGNINQSYGPHFFDNFSLTLK